MSETAYRAVRVLAADDSAVMRVVLRTLFEMHARDGNPVLPRMQLCAVVSDGVQVLEALGTMRPDVLLLDLEMPRLNGLGVLQRLRTLAPTLPVILCSTYTEKDAKLTLEALALGAKDYVMKPGQQRDSASAMDALMQVLLPKIAALGMARVAESKPQPASVPATEELSRAPVEVVVIGVSTGGPSALEAMLPRLPRSFPVPILVVQHMPKLFTEALAARLHRACALAVRLAVDGESLRAGTILLAPGDAHLEIGFSHGNRIAPRGAIATLRDGLPVNSCRPSVDLLFHSAARVYARGVLALMMTGMGADGLEGSRSIWDAGGAIIAQDEQTSAVWGMPGRVVAEGLASATLPLGALAGELIRRTASWSPGREFTSGMSFSDSRGTREVEYGLH